MNQLTWSKFLPQHRHQTPACSQAVVLEKACFWQREDHHTTDKRILGKSSQFSCWQGDWLFHRKIVACRPAKVSWRNKDRSDIDMTCLHVIDKCVVDIAGFVLSKLTLPVGKTAAWQIRYCAWAKGDTRQPCKYIQVFVRTRWVNPRKTTNIDNGKVAVPIPYKNCTNRFKTPLM